MFYDYPKGDRPRRILEDARDAQAATVSRARHHKITVTTYHYDNGRTGWNSKETVLTYQNVNSGSFGLLHTARIRVFFHDRLVAFMAEPPSSSSSLQTLYQAAAGTWDSGSGNANLVRIVANGKVFVASYEQLDIFGLLGSNAKAGTPLVKAPRATGGAPHVGEPFSARGTYDAAGVLHATTIVREKPSPAMWPIDR